MEKKRVYNLSTGRDYSYDKKYQKSKKQVKNRVIRNRDRKEAMERGSVRKGDGKDIHHAGRGMTKPRVRSRSANRGDKDHIWS